MHMGRHCGCGCVSHATIAGCCTTFHWLNGLIITAISHFHLVLYVTQQGSNKSIFISRTVIHKRCHPGCGCVSHNYKWWLVFQMLRAELADHNRYVTVLPTVLNVTQNRLINAIWYPGLAYICVIILVLAVYLVDYIY